MIGFLKKISIQKVLLIFMLVFVFGLVGCSGGEDEDENEKYTVIYDGNGGYLGNKTYTFRKLQVEENSKIPKYLAEYTEDPYVVSSLGLANREGYALKGWYLAENAEYAPNPNGAYVYLDTEVGNGYYNIDPEGDYVYGYVQDDNGPLIYIYVEALSEEDDPETIEYIFFDGGNGLGFYIYDSDDANHLEVYELEGGYAPSELTDYVGYLQFNDLSEEEKTLFAEILRYKQAYYLYTEADEGLDRYSLESGYIFYDTLFVLADEGDYVLIDQLYYLYDSENVEHQDLDRYRIDDRFIFTPTDELETPNDLARYNADITYWDFENNRVTSDMTLLAHWVKKLTVYYVQKSGQVTEITTKQNDTNTAAIDLVAGETIGKLETIPLYGGYTFINWSTSETEYIPWNFYTDVFPEDQTELYLYAYMIEGTYTRITSAKGLSNVVNNPDGNYVLVNDINLNGASFNNKSPLGFEVKSSIGATIIPFTGEFISLGYTISNFTLNIQNLQKTINEDAGVIVISALFPYAQDAVIRGVNVENVKAVLSTTSNALSVVCSLGSAGIVGTVLEGTTTITDVSVEMTFEASSTDVINHPVYVGEIVAIGSEYAVITESSATIDYTAITGITTSELIVVTLD
ncbi:MAG: InlB B-repeat-containing protein [Candidatus Izemoplasmatales bacterium]